MENLSKKKKVAIYASSFILAFLVFSLLILIYFIKGYKGKEAATFLVLGESGPGHAGSSLTDSMSFVSVNKTGTTFLSIPRDLWFDPLKTKVNALYYYGEKDGSGFNLTKDTVSTMVGQKIDYAVLVDFSVFKDLVDLVDGVDVNIVRTFTDKLYPITGKEEDLCSGDKEFKCRYEEITFQQGQTHMEGDLALKFVRSRNAQGDEGNDTARSARQQKIISALKNKVLSVEFLTSPQKLINLKKVIDERIKMDIPASEKLKLLKLAIEPQTRNFNNFVLDGWQEENGILYHPKVHSSKQWVLLPKDESWSEIHQFVSCLTSQTDKSACPQR